MNSKMAYEIVCKKYKGHKIIRCFEYDTIFSFQIVPKDLDESEYGMHLNGLVSVDKKTGDIKTFNPMQIPIEEYRNGREIKEFK